DAGRDRQQLRRGHGDLLRVPAAREQRAHLVADLPALDTLAERGDPAGALEPDDVRRAGRRRVVALPLQQVGAVDRARHHVDDDLARARDGVRDLGPLQHFRAARFPHRDRMHTADTIPSGPGAPPQRGVAWTTVGRQPRSTPRAKVSQRAGSPVSYPVRYQRSRCAEDPWLNWLSSTRPPPSRLWM